MFSKMKSVLSQGSIRNILRALPTEYSHLYLAIKGILAAVICIEDPLREEGANVIKTAKSAGFQKVVMMTGDSEHTAAAIAKKVGVDEYYSEVFPEDKADFVEGKRKRQESHYDRRWD